MKPVTWLGDSLDRVRNFARDAKQEAGHHVLHAFEKRSRKTARPDLELARMRFTQLVQERRER